MKKRYWILQTGEPIHTDNDGLKKMRCMNLSTQLLNQGNEVHIFTSSFFHQKKIHRSKKYKKLSVTNFLHIHLIPSVGYNKNFSLKRLFDHLQLAINLSSLLKTFNIKDFPDSIFIGFPPIETSYVMQKWAIQRNIPTIVDVKDQWPQIFIEPFPFFIQKIVKLILLPYFLITKRVFKNAEVICSISKPFLDWVYMFSGREPSLRDGVYPLTSEPASDKCSFQELPSQLKNILENNLETPILYFAGSITKSFNFYPVFNLIIEAQKQGLEIYLVIFGEGEEKENLEIKFSRFNNVHFNGWTKISEIEKFSSYCFCSLAPYIINDAFTRSIPNKIIDSLRNHKPVITSLQGETKKLIDRNQCGISSTNEMEIINFIKTLKSDEDLYNRYCENAKSTYEIYFDNEKNYQRLSELLIFPD